MTYELVVRESFNISGRGAAIFFDGSAEGLPIGGSFAVFIDRPDGSRLESVAAVEFALQTQPVLHEHPALVLAGLHKDEVPPDSVVSITL